MCSLSNGMPCLCASPGRSRIGHGESVGCRWFRFITLNLRSRALRFMMVREADTEIGPPGRGTVRVRKPD